MGNRWKFGDDPLVKYWKYRSLHETIRRGKTPQIDGVFVADYKKEINRALARLPKKAWEALTGARSPEQIARILQALRHTRFPHKTLEDINTCVRCTLLGGWDHRGGHWPRLVSPKDGRSAGTALVRVKGRTLPELIFQALEDSGRPVLARAKVARFIAESVAAPALYDDVSVPIQWLNAPSLSPEIESPHVGERHMCPSCGVSWLCSAIGCNAGIELLCSGCAGKIGASSTIKKAHQSESIPLPSPTKWGTSLRYSRDIVRKKRGRKRVK